MNHTKTMIAIAVVGALAGCETPRQNETAIGTGAGVATGAAIGAMVGGGKGAAIGAGVGGGLGAAVGYNWGAIRDKLGMATKDTPAVQVSQVNDGSLKVNVPGSVSFASGTATLHQRLHATLERIASTLNEYPQTSVTVVGYTVSIGSADGYFPYYDLRSFLHWRLSAPPQETTTRFEIEDAQPAPLIRGDSISWRSRFWNWQCFD